MSTRIRTTIAITALAVIAVLGITPAQAGMPAKTELNIGGRFVQTDTGPDPWQLDIELLIGLGTGHLVLGPVVAIGDDNDLNRAGAALEWNLTGQAAAVTPYIGASLTGFIKDPDGAFDRHVATGRLGLKINMLDHAAIKLGAEQVLDGAGKDITDIIWTAGILARW